MTKIMKEMITVIMGILIALVINDVKEDYDDRQFIKRSFENMSIELSSNLDNMQSSYAKQDSTLDILWQYMDDTQASLGDILEVTGGLQVASVKNIAWQAVLNKNIQLIDYEIVSLLADIDELDEVLTIQIVKLLDLVYANSDKTDYQSKKLFNMILSDILYTEEELMDAHKKCLELIKTE